MNENISFHQWIKAERPPIGFGDNFDGFQGSCRCWFSILHKLQIVVFPKAALVFQFS